jgi:hypothetical protein
MGALIFKDGLVLAISILNLNHGARPSIWEAKHSQG